MSEIDPDLIKKLVAEEIAKQASSGNVISSVPAGEVESLLPHREQAGNYWYDPRTKRPFDPGVKRQLWRPDNVKQCACGEQKWAHVQEYVGEMAIVEALRPVIDSRTGRLVQMPHQNAYSEYDQVGRPILSSCLIPEELRHTPEKAAHARECNGERIQELRDGGDLEQINKAAATKVIRMARHGT